MNKKLIILFTIFLSLNLFGQNIEHVKDENTGAELEISSDNFPEPFFFDKDSSTYYKKEYIQKISSDLLKIDNTEILLTGHCTILEQKSNPSISINRIKEIKKLLIESGYDENRIVIKDEKTNQPRSSSPESNENRRVDWFIIQR
ncbi:OmpA family protein [Mangrovimonas sp. TPBH4]|uniref:OmpA family protein n=1 Tax=Mangrovimonas sp. TPBH4 TaxID=1645914 RepID=UPI0006B61EB7|nr:OmpA family protein [Mangrovimonas sp. TPBH4]